MQEIHVNKFINCLKSVSRPVFLVLTRVVAVGAHPLQSCPDSQAREVAILVDLLDVNGQWALYEGQRFRILGVLVAQPHVLPGFFLDARDVANGDVGAIRAGAEPERDLSVLATPHCTRCTEKQHLALLLAAPAAVPLGRCGRRAGDARFGGA